MNFDGKYGNFLMVVATGISTLACLVIYLRSDRRDTKVITRSCWYFPVLAGILNALLNLFVILMATSDLSPSLIYPVIAVGGLAVTSIFSLVAFKEKLHWWQWVGVAVGAVAVALLSL
jgi:drug/metabolite transporter (DMT)-like permease